MCRECRDGFERDMQQMADEQRDADERQPIRPRGKPAA
jgi:hypothetical protein